MNMATAIFVAIGGSSLFGAIVGAIATFSLNRASAAKLLTEAAVATGRQNQALHDELRDLRKAVLALTDAVDEAIPELNAGPVRVQLALVNTAAKLAV